MPPCSGFVFLPCSFTDEGFRATKNLPGRKAEEASASTGRVPAST